MMGRFVEPESALGDAASASASGMAAWAPTPAATAPSIEVFTKSRREKVTGSPEKWF
jgi:hypothetical protein